MQKYIFLLAILLLFSCGDNENIENNVVEVDSVEVNDEITKVNYEFIQGEDLVESKKILIVVIDPHGDGELAVSKFQKVVKNFNCTVIGLNDVENGQQDFMYRIKNNIDVAIVELELDVEQIYFAGFSGGAKMAFYYGFENETNGVLMCGATVPGIWTGLPFSIAFVTGTQDVDFSSVYYSPFTNAIAKMDFLSFVFEGKHEWPSEKYILNAFVFLFSENNINISEFNFDFEQESQNYLNKNKDYLAYKSLEACFKIYEDENIKLKINKFGEDEDFKKYMQNYEIILNAGIRRNGDYLKMLPTIDINWWTNEILEIIKQHRHSHCKFLQKNKSISRIGNVFVCWERIK
jgi:hypothetical protein